LADATLIAAYYFTFFGALGCFMPYFALWLTGHGLSPAAATRLQALMPLMSLLAPPLSGLLADARRARQWLLRVSSLGCALSFAGFFVARRPWELGVTTALYALCRAPIIPLTDSAALDWVRHHGGSYGRLRLWGSLGFLIAVVGGGALMQALGVGVMMRACLLMLVVCAQVAWRLPPPPSSEARPGALAALAAMLRDRGMKLLLAAGLLAQVATAAYDSCFSLHLQRLGFGGRFIGVAWATGVAAEIVLLAVAHRVLERVGAARLLGLALATAAARWLTLSRVRSGAAILLLQPLHGVTFGFFWVAAVTLVRQRGQAAPSAAQGLLAASMALGSLAGMTLAGRLLEEGGGRALYGSAAGFSALATLCALIYVRQARASEYP
jgi:PPP family 3-phenylpropionic acid transporter